MTSITSLRAFKATRTLTPTHGQQGAKRVVAALEAASSNMHRFALAQRLLNPPQQTLRFLQTHQYLERDRCEACGNSTQPNRRISWKNKQKRVYACNRRCAKQVLKRVK